ncbi:MAG: EMC3/TMCO1 family protein [Candidatus Hadarchaeales archaeon]
MSEESTAAPGGVAPPPPQPVPKGKGRLVEVSVVLLVLLALGATLWAVFAHRADTPAKVMLGKVDQSLISLRHGSETGAKDALGRAKEDYLGLRSALENVDPGLDNQILTAFDNQLSAPSEEGILSLRSLLERGISKAGLEVPLAYGHATSLVLLISLLFSLFVTMLTRRMVDWEKMRRIRKEVASWQAELREAQRKKDMKKVHKMMTEQGRILSLQGEMMRESFRPTLVYLFPWLLLWALLSRIYVGWVMAWLPFSLPLPFFGEWSSCGFVGWLFITYFVFSHLWRRLLIGE